MWDTVTAATGEGLNFNPDLPSSFESRLVVDMQFNCCYNLLLLLTTPYTELCYRNTWQMICSEGNFFRPTRKPPLPPFWTSILTHHINMFTHPSSLPQATVAFINDFYTCSDKREPIDDVSCGSTRSPALSNLLGCMLQGMEEVISRFSMSNFSRRRVSQYRAVDPIADSTSRLDFNVYPAKNGNSI